MCCSIDDMPKESVPWGLNLELSERELSLLSIDNPKVGSEMTAQVTMRVRSYGENEQDGGEKSRHASLAVIAMDLGGDKDEGSAISRAASKVYGGD